MSRSCPAPCRGSANHRPAGPAAYAPLLPPLGPSSLSRSRATAGPWSSRSMRSALSKERSGAKWTVGATLSSTSSARRMRKKAEARLSALASACASPPPKGTTKAVAARKSGLTRTSVTVTLRPASSGSRNSPRARISASACRNASPTLSCRWPGALLLLFRVIATLASGELARDFFDLETLDLIAALDVVVVLERHTAFEPFLDLAHFVLEALQRLQRTFVDHHVVAQQAHPGAALDHAFGDHAAGDLADLGDLEDFADFRVTQEALAQRGRKHAGKGGLHVIDDVVDDRVVADIDLVALGEFARLGIGAYIEADDEAARGAGQRHVGFIDAADGSMKDPRADFVGSHLLQRCHDRFQRA